MPQRPKMTWTERAAAGVDARHFQAALAKGGGLTNNPSEALGRPMSKGLISDSASKSNAIAAPKSESGCS
jgi:hypothetical protein